MTRDTAVRKIGTIWDLRDINCAHFLEEKWAFTTQAYCESQRFFDV
jgi:hypothetical protein